MLVYTDYQWRIIEIPCGPWISVRRIEVWGKGNEKIASKIFFCLTVSGTGGGGVECGEGCSQHPNLSTLRIGMVT